uniref:Related to small nuclear ribonucleoprotein snRNP U1A n=1 Tax=Melanopsichium pennsylvanicum 4 TaxID=1398559 RepID=A0A077QQS2_9BASI|nr:related to small nuclear ribonucleoprotein snRNP U1A [Melanopsichium pennsylvanicum 4]
MSTSRASPFSAAIGSAPPIQPPPSIPPPALQSAPPSPFPHMPMSMPTPMDQSDTSDLPHLPSDASKTLYIQNLNEKVKQPTMKATLTNLFSNYGNVLSVVSHTNLRMRGQAFVSLHDVHAADKARREAHLFPLYGKAMKISFAKSKSDSVVIQELKQDGKREESEEFKKHKDERLEHKKIARRGNILRRRELEKKIRAKRAAAGEIAEPEKATANKRMQQEMPDEYLPPNKMLFLQNIPDGVGKGELESLFSAYSGYVDVQTIPGKADIAFVEFSDIPSSATARGALNGYNFGAGDKLKVQSSNMA